MPLTPFQSEVALLLAKNRSFESHLAGGAALHFEPLSLRYSQDLDYFHDTQAAVEAAFIKDRELLEQYGIACITEVQLKGYVRAIAKKDNSTTKIEWAHDSAWRFMPVQKNNQLGYVLHPVDLWINKFLALVGRDEPRDFLDIIYIHENFLTLGALCWGACGKDPGYNPNLLIDLLKRKGRYQDSDFQKLNLTKKIVLSDLKSTWLEALKQAENFVNICPEEYIGCLFYSTTSKKFVTPDLSTNMLDADVKPHFCRLNGVVPQFS